MKKLTFILLLIGLIACSPIYKAKHGKYVIKPNGDTCLPCRLNYVLIGDSCVFVEPKPSKIY